MEESQKFHRNPWQVQGGSPKIAFSWFRKVAELTMVYGRYNELVNGGLCK